MECCFTYQWTWYVLLRRFELDAAPTSKSKLSGRPIRRIGWQGDWQIGLSFVFPVCTILRKVSSTGRLLPALIWSTTISAVLLFLADQNCSCPIFVSYGHIRTRSQEKDQSCGSRTRFWICGRSWYWKSDVSKGIEFVKCVSTTRTRGRTVPWRRSACLAIGTGLLVWHDVLLWFDEYNWNIPSLHQPESIGVLQPGWHRLDLWFVSVHSILQRHCHRIVIWCARAEVSDGYGSCMFGCLYVPSKRLQKSVPFVDFVTDS